MAGTHNEGFRAATPNRLIDNDQDASHAIQIENGNQDTNYNVQKDSTVPRASKCSDCMWFFSILIIMSGLTLGLPIYASHHSPYSYSKDIIYNHHMKTAKFGIDFYVKSGFKKTHPVGSPARVKLEDKIIKHFNDTEQRLCDHELWYRNHSANPNSPTPDCNKLLSKGINITSIYL